MVQHRTVLLATVLATSTLALFIRLPQEAPPKFYYYHGDSVKLVDAPELVSGVLADPADSLWLERQARAERLPPLRRRSIPRKPGYFVLRFDRQRATARSDALFQRLAANARVRLLYRGFRTFQGSEVILTGEVVARWKPETASAQIDSVAAASGFEIAEQLDRSLYQLTVFRATTREQDPLAFANALFESGLVKYATPNFITDRRQLGVPSDPFFPDQFHLKNSIYKAGIRVDINAVPAWNWSTGSGMKIAVIDGAIECDHPEFDDRVLPGYDSFAGSSANECNPATTLLDAHATMVAATALGNHGQGKVAGVAPDAYLIPVRIFDQWGEIDDEHAVAVAIQWAWETGGADILNNSWSEGAYNEEIEDAIIEAFEQGRGGKGSPVVFSAGNNPVPVTFPANVYGAYAVSGINRRGNESQYARGADAVAPVDSGSTGHYENMDFVTADRSGLGGWNTGCQAHGCGSDYSDHAYTRNFGGTSAAAPQVSGIAAMILDLKLTLGPQDVYGAISGPADDWHTSGWDSLSGNGKVNAYLSARRAGPVLDVAMDASERWVTRKKRVKVFDDVSHYWTRCGHTHNWTRDGYFWDVHYDTCTKDTTQFISYGGICDTTEFTADVTNAWKSGSGSILIFVATDPDCDMEPLAPRFIATRNKQSTEPLLFGAGPLVLGESGTPKSAVFYSLAGNAQAKPLSRGGPATVAGALTEGRAGLFRADEDTLAIAPETGASSAATVSTFTLRGRASATARTLAFAFDPDVGDAANDELVWLPDRGAAVAGDSADGYWGVRLLLTDEWQQRIIQYGHQGAGPDPGTTEELESALRHPESVVASKPSDVRFLMVATLLPEDQRTDAHLAGHVVIATGPSVEDVAAKLAAAKVSDVAVLEPPSAAESGNVPGAFGLGQVISRYTGPLFRIEGIAAVAADAAELSPTEAVAQVRAAGIRALRVDVPSEGDGTRVVVHVYSTAGRLVRRLVDETLEPGRYVVGWDACDQSGSPVRPGVYIAVMTAGPFRGIQRLIIK